MSQADVLTRLALRELWMTFRLLMVLAGFVVAGATVALLASPPPIALERLAIGLGAATALASGVAAWSFAEERRSGRAGWLVTRSVSRTTYLTAWFAATLAVTLAGLAAAATLGWMSVVAMSGLGPIGYAVTVGAVGADAAAAVAFGLLAGAVARPAVAAIVSVAACWCGVAAALLVPLPPTVVAYPLLPRLGSAEVVPDGMAAAGVGLTLAAAFLALTRLALARAEL